MSLVFECRAKSKQFDDKKHGICFHYTSSKSVVLHKTNICFVFDFLLHIHVLVHFKELRLSPLHVRVQLVPLKKKKKKQNVSVGCANVIS